MAEFKLQTSSDQGYRFNLNFYLEIGKSAILLVDDDTGENYERYFRQMAFQRKQNYNTWNIATQGLPADTLSSFDIVVWFTGNDSTSSLTPEEQEVLKTYLDQGGRLALSGANIGRELMIEGTTEDSLFYTNYLHASYLDDNAATSKLFGVGGDPISSGLSVHLEGVYPSANNQHSPSVIAPTANASAILTYLPSRETAAIRYENPENDSRVVYFAFGLEGIAGPREDTAGILFYNTIKWLSGFSTSVSEFTDKSTLPATYQLNPNYPNPFNPETHISFDLPKKAQVTLKIFNTMGQEIKTLVDAPRSAGTHQIVWYGDDKLNQPVSSGVYFFRLTTGEFSQTRKMLLMR